MANEHLHDSDLEAEGIPELEGMPPGKVAAGDVAEGLVPPRDHPQGADEIGITPAEEIHGDTLAERVAREEPDAAVVGGAGEGALAGRVVQPDEGWAGDLDVDAEEEGVAVGGPDDLSAEESAVHVVTNPPGLGRGGDGYLGDD